MTKDQYEKIERFKPQFLQAKGNFVRVSRGDLDIIRQVYNDVFKKSLLPSNMTCNSCVLKMLKQLGEALEKYEEWKDKFNGGRKKKEEECKRNSNIEPQEPAGEGN